MSPGKLVVKEDVKETEILLSERNIKFLLEEAFLLFHIAVSFE